MLRTESKEICKEASHSEFSGEQWLVVIVQQNINFRLDSGEGAAFDIFRS
jgi:hypothetical protein